MSSTWSADKALAEDGLSVADFIAWRKKKYGEPQKQSREDWLNGYRDCAHCEFDGNCSSQNFGYYQDVSVVQDGNRTLIMASGPHYNRRSTQKNFKACCRWPKDVANALHDKAEQMVKEGRIYE